MEFSIPDLNIISGLDKDQEGYLIYTWKKLVDYKYVKHKHSETYGKLKFLHLGICNSYTGRQGKPNRRAILIKTEFSFLL